LEKAFTMTTAAGIIKGALRRIASYQSGEQLAQTDSDDCLETLNDLLDSWSTDEMFVFGSNEHILQWVTGQNQYTIGNPTCSALGKPPFTGTLTSGSPTITGVTNIPTDLVAGATLTDLANVIPTGTTVLSVGATSVTMSANATATPAGNDTVTYTIPGDFAIARPLRITGGYTRVSQLDFWLDVYATQDQYNSVLYKAQGGPWPVLAWYNNAFPYGILNVYQTPSQTGTLHLFTDTILSNLTLNQVIIVPQGYVRALKWCLALELAPEYGFQPNPQFKKNAYEALQMIKSLNAQPAARAKYDRELVRGNRPDGGWIVSGGYSSNNS
jgi:hypothetical protein